jgi:hypothetical protein
MRAIGFLPCFVSAVRLASNHPTHEPRGGKAFYHYNGITSWGVAESGEVKHVYA